MTTTVRTLNRPTAVLIIFAGALLVTGGLAYVLSNPATTDTDTLALRKSLAGLSLASTEVGPEAIAEITRLHGKEFPLTSGAMGMYGVDAQATVWVASLSSETAAQQLVTAMRDKIAEGRSPFTPVTARPLGRRTIYELDGMGQKHFYFQSSDRVIWLAADPDIAAQALPTTLEFYP